MGSSASKAAGSSSRRFPSRAPGAVPKSPQPPRQPGPQPGPARPVKPKASTSKTDGIVAYPFTCSARLATPSRVWEANTSCFGRHNIRLHKPRCEPRRVRPTITPDGDCQPHAHVLELVYSRSRAHAKPPPQSGPTIPVTVEESNPRLARGEAQIARKGRRRV